MIDTSHDDQLDGRRVAILATDGVEQSELTEPRTALTEAGARTYLIAPQRADIQAWAHDRPAGKLRVDLTLDEAAGAAFDALLIPGGVVSTDALRQDRRAVRFVKHFVTTGKPVAAICHAPWLLIEAEAVRNRLLTSYPSLKTDLENAGAHWVNRDVVVDEGIVTSRTPGDIPAFNAKMIEEFREGEHPQRQESKHESEWDRIERRMNDRRSVPVAR